MCHWAYMVSEMEVGCIDGREQGRLNVLAMMGSRRGA